MSLNNTTLLLPATTLTVTGAGVAIATPYQVTRWALVLSVAAITGTTPTLDVTVQHSLDGTNWITLRAFTQLAVAGANSTVHLLAAAATDYLNPILPYIRASYVVAGTTPSFASVTIRLLTDR